MTALTVTIFTILTPVLIGVDMDTTQTLLQPAHNNPQATVHSYYIEPVQLTSHYQPALHSDELHNLTVYKLEVK